VIASQELSALRGEICVGSILPFIARSGAVFNDVATQVMGEAFDAACNELHDKGQPTVVYDVIAKRIIDAARNGERDPVRLRNVGLAALGIDRGCVETGDRDTLDQPVSPKTIPPGNPEGP
jgi:hypothetical protein